MWLLGEDGNGRRGGGTASSAGISLPRQLSREGGSEGDKEKTSLRACQCLPESPGHTSSFQALGFFLSMREVPSLLLKQEKEGVCRAQGHSGTAFPTAPCPCVQPPQEAPGAGAQPRLVLPLEGLHAAALLALPQENTACPCHASVRALFISNSLYLHALKRDLGRPLLVLLP